MKKVLILLVLATVIAGGVFAQNNWVAGSVNLLGGGAQYERQLTEKFSVGADISYNTLIFFWNWGIEAFGRYYIWNGLNVGLGLGFGQHLGVKSVAGQTLSPWFSTTGFLIEPKLAWRIDPGQKGAFFIEPSVGVPIVIGSQKYTTWVGTAPSLGAGVGVGVVVSVALGYAF